VRRTIKRRSDALSEMLERRSMLAFAPGPVVWDHVAMRGTGFVTGISYSQAEANLIYVQTDMGGSYRWDQSLARWTPLNDWSKYNDWSVQQLGVDAIAADPTDANRVYQVAGTYNSPAAILRSSDRGNTWSRWNSPWDNTNSRYALRANGNGNGRTVGARMAIDPNLPTKLLFGSRMDGLWQSSDRAASWSKVASFTVTGDASGTAGQTGISWVVFDKSSGTPGTATPRIYAGVATSLGTKVFRSNDAGATWAALPGQPTSATLFPLRAALTPDGSTLYVTYSDHVGPNGASTGAVYKVSGPSAASPVWATVPLPVLSSGGWSGVTIDPTNANRIVVSTLDRWGAKDDLYRSTDAGATWKAVNIRAQIDNSSAPFANSVGPHWISDVQFDPFDSNELMFTTGNGLYRTSNLGALDSNNPAAFRFFNDGIEQALVSELVSPPTGAARLFSTVGDRDGFRHTDLSVSPAEGCLGQSQNIRFGSGSDIAVAWNDARYLVRSGSSNSAQFSSDNGVTWTRFAALASGVSGGEIEISPDGTRAVWDPGSATPVFASRSGTTWSSWSSVSFTGATPADNVRLAADLSLPNTFYAYQGTSVWRSTDGGATFALLTATAPASGNSLRSVFTQAGHLVLSTGFSNTGLWRSTDGGATWARLATTALTTALEVGVGAAPPGRSYPALFVAGMVSSKTGFFRSDDQGATWVEISNASKQFGIPKVIQGDPLHYGRAYIGTDGRGVQWVEFADRTAPVVLPAGFSFDVNTNAVLVPFSEDVSGTLEPADLTITRIGTGSVVVPTGVTFDAATKIARFALPAGMANADYSASISATGVSDAAGNRLGAGASGSFFVLAGDATRDRMVDFSDLLVLASNYNRASGAVWTDGDFTRDGRVNFDDLLILASGYNQGLQSAVVAPAPLSGNAPPDDDDSLVDGVL
jgi:hypothetical protein